MKTSIAMLVLLAATLGGCTDTLFESPPGDNVSSCDKHFVGNWRVLATDDKDKNKDSEMFLIVEPQCKRWRFIEDGKEDEKLAKTTHIAFGNVGGKALLTVKVDEDKPAADSRWRNGYYFLSYTFADKTIRLRGVDDKRIAHRIIDGSVLGRTERVSREPGDKRSGGSGSSELHNFVAGDPAEMARVAQLEDVFADADTYLLKPASKAEIFKARKKNTPKP